MANTKACREKARSAGLATSWGLAAACEGDEALMSEEQDLQVEGAVDTTRGKLVKVKCKTCGIAKDNNHFHSMDSGQCCRQCTTT